MLSHPSHALSLSCRRYHAIPTPFCCVQLSVSAWQKATNSWAAHTNARINRMNAHVAANAAQIKENAKKARKDLDNAMASWDHKVNKFRCLPFPPKPPHSLFIPNSSLLTGAYRFFVVFPTVLVFHPSILPVVPQDRREDCQQQAWCAVRRPEQGHQGLGQQQD